MKKNILLLTLLIFILSCQDDIVKEQSQSKEIPQEIKNSNELPESKAKHLLEICINQLKEKNRLKSSNKLSISNTKKNYIKVNNTTLRSTNSNHNNQDSIAIYNFIVENGNDNGFGLVLGDARFPQVLSYAPVGSLNDTLYNEGLKEWINMLPTYVEELYNNYHTFNKDSLIYEVYDKDKPIGGEWACVRDSFYLGTESVSWGGITYNLINAYFKVTNYQYSIDKILQTQWDQSEPYNNNMQFFPSGCNKPGQKIYTGCVTTAIAQLMAHFEWPQGYNWNLLKQTRGIFTSSLPTQINEVARLMKDLQGKLSPDIKCGGTGVKRAKTNDVMKRYFNYKKPDYGFLCRDNKNYPCLTLAQTPSGNGHAFIIDGYCEIECMITGYCVSYSYKKSSGNYVTESGGFNINLPYLKFDLYEDVDNFFPAFHINWGWGGYSDGWYGDMYGNKYSNNTEYFTCISRK